MLSIDGGVGMKRLLCILLIVALFVLGGCVSPSEDLVGDWILIYGESEFGYLLRFEKDGAMLCTPGIANGSEAKDHAKALEAMADYMTITYTVKNFKTVVLTVQVFSTSIQLDIDYQRQDDVLIFGTGTYLKVE